MFDKNTYITETLFAIIFRYIRTDLLPYHRYMFFDDLPHSAGDKKLPYELLYDYLMECKIKPPLVGINSGDRRYIMGYHKDLLEIADQTDETKPYLVTVYEGEYVVRADFSDLIKIYKPNYDFERNDCFVSTEFSSDDLEKLFKPIGLYLSKYINNELVVTDKSYLRFEYQKKKFIKFINDNEFIEKYGKNFVLEYLPFEKGLGPDFLFVHTLFAMEALGYIELKGFWFRKMLTDADYFANIVVTDLLIEEMNKEFRKENPQTVLTNFNNDTGTILFMGKEIEISKNGKETDPLALMRTLSKQKGSGYVYNDEILEDWGYSIEEAKGASKNKIYHAGQKINQLVQIATGIEDFIEITTTKARINPKYRNL